MDLGMSSHPTVAVLGTGIGADGAQRAGHGLDLPLLDAIEARFAQGVERGHGDLDMSAAFLTSAGG
jgi:hypothetical protein